MHDDWRVEGTEYEVRVTTHEAPESLRKSLAEADRCGRALVTVIGGRLALLMPPDESTDAQSERLHSVLRALDADSETEYVSMERITRESDKMMGKACIRGLRIPVETVVRCFADGMSRSDILHDYPDLDRDDLRAALEYAARSIDTDPTPGFPPPPGGERVEDLVTLDGLDPKEQHLLRRAAESALRHGIEPGLRRTRYIEGWLDGHRADP